MPPFDFDEADQTTVPASTVTQAAVDQLFEEPSESQDEWDAQMSEVEARLEKAQYYRTLMNQSLFETDSEIGREVEAEVRDFVRTRMSVLVGATLPKPKSEFTVEEVAILKEVATKLAKNAKLLPVPKEPPKVNQVRAVTQPTVAPAIPAQPPAIKPTKPPARPVGRPKTKPPVVKQPAVVTTTTAKPAGRKAVSLGETITMKAGPNPDSPTKTYRKVQTDRGVGYIGDDGAEYSLATNGLGESYMRNESRQSVGIDAKPKPAVNSTQYQIVAQDHATAALRGVNNNPILSRALSEVLKG